MDNLIREPGRSRGEFAVYYLGGEEVGSLFYCQLTGYLYEVGVMDQSGYSAKRVAGEAEGDAFVREFFSLRSRVRRMREAETNRRENDDQSTRAPRPRN